LLHLCHGFINRYARGRVLRSFLHS
jgi:hypothetical protein